MFPKNRNVHNVRTTYKLTIQLECETQCDTSNTMLDEIYKNNRRLSQRRHTELLVFEPPKSFEKLQPIETQVMPRKTEPRNWRTAVNELIHRFSKGTTIHGLNHVCSRELGWKRRLIWFITFATALLAAIYVVVGLAARFNSKQFETVIDSTSYPAYKIYFPEVVICNKNRLNWKRLEEAQQMFLTAQHQTVEMRENFARIIGLYDNMTYGRFNLFNALPDDQVLQQLNYINFTNVVEFMSWHCNELFYNCVWGQREFNCCDIFTRRRSQLGQCLAFNNVEGEEGKRMLRKHSKWPWRTGNAGPGSGLKLRIMLDDKLNFPNSSRDAGITVMLVEPFAYNDVTTDVIGNTKATISMNNVLHFYDNYTLALHPDVRKCIFEGEQQKYGFRTLIGHKYMYENCQAECQQKYLLRFCNCTFDLFFPPAGHSSCKLVDLPCLAQNNHQVLLLHQPEESLYINLNITGKTCKCYFNCYSLTYTPDARFLEFKEHTADELGKGIIELNVFYKSKDVLVYRTSLVFTWVDLLVSFGGIAALFLGCSLMSIVELGVFFFIGVPQVILHHHQEMKHQRNKNQKFKGIVQKIIKRNLLTQVNILKA